MTKHRTRIIGSAIAGTGAAALVIAGMAFGMPTFDEERDPALTESARARQELRQRDAATTGTSSWQPSDPSRAKAGAQVLPAQAASATVAAPSVVAAAAEEPASAPSPVAAGEREWDDDDHAEYAEHEEGDDEHEEGDDEHEEGDEYEGGDDD
jgi:hypothetical protein